MARSLCTACHQWFSSSSSFDRHRAGSYGDPIYGKGKDIVGYTKHDRHCMSEQAMLDKGMAKNDKGLWVTELLEEKPSFWRKEDA